ncbi:MAG: glycosyltransferase family 39 protein [Puniceicoccales bacterium]|jgi:hypothetical protein|nr:glycosyltransferase family 39 protein [Puniceicoccales bacterium]
MTIFSKEFRSRYILFGVCLIVLLGATLAPFGGDVIGMDSSAYIYVAKQVLAGRHAYLDALDHKGPFLYLIDAAGMFLAGGNFVGIWVLELLALSTAAVSIHKLLLLYFPARQSLLGTISALLFLCPVLNGGNVTEEWALPFICATTYFCARSVKNGLALSRAQLALIGVSFTLVLLIKLTLVAAWGGLWIAVLLKTLQSEKADAPAGAGELVAREWVPALSASAFAALAAALAFLPFLVYFLLTRTLGDFWYGAFYFNLFEYKFTATGGGTLLWFLKKNTVLFALPLTGCLLFAFSRKDRGGAISLGLFFSVCACLVGGTFSYYLIICAPFFAIGFAHLFAIAGNLSERFAPVTGSVLVAAAFLFINAVYFPYETRNLLRNYSDLEFQPSRCRFVPNERRAKMARIREIVESNTTPADKILVRGYASYIYLHTRRECAGAFPYPLINSSRVQQDYATGAAKLLPKLILQGTGVQSTADMVSLGALLSEKYRPLPTGYPDVEAWLLSPEGGKQ